LVKLNEPKNSSMSGHIENFLLFPKNA